MKIYYYLHGIMHAQKLVTLVLVNTCTNDLHNLHKSVNEIYIHKSRSNDFGHFKCKCSLLNIVIHNSQPFYTFFTCNDCLYTLQGVGGRH
jgi:hypothetical protein